MKRVIIFTGKGGVGKTSIAAAHARKASLEGYKTLLVSTDMAHNLSDLFECEIGRTETKIAENLYGLEIDPTYEMNHDFASMMKAFQKLISFQREEEENLELLEMFPGIEELFSLLKIRQLYEKRDYEVMIVDCAPTGETLSLLKFPELMSWYMEKLFPIERVVMKIARPVTKAFFKLELPDEKAMNDMERLYLKLGQLEEFLKNQEVCSVRLVTLPEKMVVEETKRNYMYMNLYGFYVDGIYINRVLPEAAANSFFAEWMRIQAQYLEELEAVFDELPMVRIPWFDLDLIGLESLDRIIETSLCEQDLLAVRPVRRAETFTKTQNGYCLKMYLPAAVKSELEIHQVGSDLSIKVGTVKRNIRNPDILRGYQISSAKLEAQILTITFEKEDAQ